MNQIHSNSSSNRPRKKRKLVFFAIAFVMIGFAIFFWRGHQAENGDGKKQAVTQQPAAALTVKTATAKTEEWPLTLQASGSITAWQEGIIGSEISGQRIVEVLVNVGDEVKKGQVLARYNADTLKAEQAELLAMWKQAESDRKRAASLKDSGALSDQEIENYANQAAIAKARLDSKNLQLGYATVVAPDDGTISQRTATVGAIGVAGNELFRMIIKNRLEWRGELSAEQLAQVKIGQLVELTLPDQSSAKATIRQLAPSLDPQSRLGLVYADIEPGSHAQPGMYASGIIAMQVDKALNIPAVSVIIRDGRSYVFTVSSGTTGKVLQKLVTTGRHQDGDVEIKSGLTEGERVVTQGAGFLNDGDIVRIADDTGVAK